MVVDFGRRLETRFRCTVSGSSCVTLNVGDVFHHPTMMEHVTDSFHAFVSKASSRNVEQDSRLRSNKSTTLTNYYGNKQYLKSKHLVSTHENTLLLHQ